MSSLMASEQREQLDGLQQRALVVGAVALIVCVIGAFFDPLQFFRAYLAAYIFCLGLGLGSLVILMIYHLTAGAWGFIVRRILEASTRTIPLLAVLFVPVACGVSWLYLWTDPAQVAADRSLQYKHLYLNLPFFYGRAVLFFILWSLMAYLLNRWSHTEDQSDNPVFTERMKTLSGPGLVVYGVSITFAAVDWVMSLQPGFHSTIFGPIIASSELLSSLSFTILVMVWLSSRPPLAEVVSTDSNRDHGNLLLTFLILWAYMLFFQFLLIWIANLPYEVIWYLPRTRHGWEWVTWALFIFGLVVPFFALLMREVKAKPRPLAQTAGLLLFMQLVFVYYLVVPNFPDGSIFNHWMDFLTPLAVGGLWLAYFLYQLKQRPLLPLHDLSRVSATRLRQLDVEEHEEEEAAHA